MATHSSILAWESSWAEETGGLPSTGSQRVGQHKAAPSIMEFLQNKKLCGRKSGVFIFLFSFLYCLILKKLLF